MAASECPKQQRFAAANTYKQKHKHAHEQEKKEKKKRWRMTQLRQQTQNRKNEKGPDVFLNESGIRAGIARLGAGERKVVRA